MTTAIAALTVAGSLFACLSPSAFGIDADAAVTVTSVRSFPKLNATRVDLLVESASIAVDGSAAWGGVESLDVPQTKSQAELDAEAQAAAQEAAAQAEAQAETEARAQAASRASRRTATNDAQAAASDAAGDDADAAADAAASGEVSTSQNGAAVATGNGAAVVAYALQFQGVPYVYGGSTTSGWDCSGFTSYVFRRFGVTLSHSSSAQRGSGTRVTDPQPGDLMWKPGHVGIYIGNGRMVHASTPATGTLVASTSYYSGWEYYRLV
ncbi:C40 family peptidase [Bifidobacterium moraviense]|uniref:C40 family peptidase n=1 Tax=Bifidobacterium moraviense TaxID=2675323 RepID=UPI001F0FCF62|nr:C40 family peptidase [Bifidobacterium sp. DSM 109958]